MAKLKETGGDFVTYHTSGHIFTEDIEKFVKDLNPGHVVPIHTTGRTEFQKRLRNVLLVEDGENSIV
jgi:mRNA degradation ribonuclease J1/J2